MMNYDRENVERLIAGDYDEWAAKMKGALEAREQWVIANEDALKAAGIEVYAPVTFDGKTYRGFAVKP